jgi:hypothetical protein
LLDFTNLSFRRALGLRKMQVEIWDP